MSPWTGPVPGASPRIIHDGVEPVSNGEHSTAFELRPDGGLDDVIRFQVHGSRGLIQHKDLRLPQQGPGQAHKLALPDADREKETRRHSVRTAPDPEPRPERAEGRETLGVARTRRARPLPRPRLWQT